VWVYSYALGAVIVRHIGILVFRPRCRVSRALLCYIGTLVIFAVTYGELKMQRWVLLVISISAVQESRPLWARRASRYRAKTELLSCVIT
jgi:hypothetical protein